jgi:protein-disulfide isomerase
MSQLRVPVSESDHIKGNNNAPIELVEYGDYQCPYCGEAYTAIKELEKRLGKKLKFVFRNFPLTNTHANAEIAALAAESAAAQGKFWEMYEMLFKNQNNLQEADLIGYAEKIGLDMGKFKNDLDNKSYLQKVKDDFESGVRSGVNRTPSFYVNGDKEDELDEDKLLELIKDQEQIQFSRG